MEISVNDFSIEHRNTTKIDSFQKMRMDSRNGWMVVIDLFFGEVKLPLIKLLLRHLDQALQK